MEIWKKIPLFNNEYEVSNLGRVRSLDRYTNDRYGNPTLRHGRILKQSNSNGYKMVRVTIQGLSRSYGVHQLVSLAFIDEGYIENNLVTDHIDGNRSNNNLSNLQVVTHRENISRSKSGSSKYRGVYFCKASKKWKAQIQHENKKIHLGFFTEESEASIVYQQALNKLRQSK